jgi:hypothetical protein
LLAATRPFRARRPRSGPACAVESGEAALAARPARARCTRSGPAALQALLPERRGHLARQAPCPVPESRISAGAAPAAANASLWVLRTHSAAVGAARSRRRSARRRSTGHAAPLRLTAGGRGDRSARPAGQRAGWQREPALPRGGAAIPTSSAWTPRPPGSHPAPR